MLKKLVNTILFLIFINSLTAQDLTINNKVFDKEQIKTITYTLNILNKHFITGDCNIYVLENKIYPEYTAFYTNQYNYHYIFLNKNLRNKKLIYVLIHEYIHLLQVYSKTAIFHKNNLILWKKDRIDASVDYLEREWEQDAYIKTPKIYNNLFKIKDK